ncbi:MAG TPA: hypothetical protein VGG64_26860 [Pirellulales bacterium]|jgi:hypothetical protein
MAIAEERPRLEPHVSSLLAQLRQRIRRYIVVEGLAATIATLCATFWLSLAVDWFFEPPVAWRRGLLGLGAIATVVVFYRLVILRLATSLSDTRLALLLERRFRAFDDSLLTSVDLTQSDRDLGEFGREMLSHTLEQAAHRAHGVRLDDIFRRTPLVRSVVAAAVLVATLAVGALAVPATMRFGVDRLTGATDDPWPRTSRLVIVGFENGEKVVAKGDDVDVLVRADLSMPHVPEIVQIRYATEEGVRGRDTLTRVGNATIDQDEYQDFRHTFSSVLSSLSFDVFGGDARVRDLRIRVVDSPTVDETTLLCEYPAYMNRSPHEIPVTGSMQIPLGTRITVRARANKDLIRAQIDYPIDDKTLHTETVLLPSAGDDLRTIRFTMPELAGDATLAFTLFDTDGIHNRKPFVVSLSAVADESPQISLQLRGIGTAITPQARLPLVGQIVDDYGVAAAAFNVTIDEQEAQHPAFATAPAGQNEVDVDEAFEVRELALKAGQKVLFGAQATDGYHLVDGDHPHTALGERFQLDVVTPETLRAMLESRELNLRQRYETIIDEVTETRNSLAELPADQAETSPASPSADDQAKGNDATKSSDSADADAPSLAHLRVERARQNAEKNAQETLGVAVAFDEIREELINNRVDTEELKIRLKDHIAEPLKGITEKMFPEWDRRLKALLGQLHDPQSAPAARRAAVEQADAILVEMVRVRDKMLELESFNEAIEMLRSIITSEKTLQDQIRERQKRKVRDLLEDSP